MLIVSPDRDDDPAVARERTDAVPDAVFNERLKEQRREIKIADARFDTDVDGEARAETPLLDRDVRSEKLDLLRDPNEAAILELERALEQRLQVAHDRARFSDVVVRRFRRELQGIEEKVRLQLQGQ